jgi:hypothetical protein
MAKAGLARIVQHGGAGKLPGLEAHGPAAIGMKRLMGDEEVPALEAVDFPALTMVFVQLAPLCLPAGNGIPG